jgi:hypothetical protein
VATRKSPPQHLIFVDMPINVPKDHAIQGEE